VTDIAGWKWWWLGKGGGVGGGLTLLRAGGKGRGGCCGGDKVQGVEDPSAEGSGGALVSAGIDALRQKTVLCFACVRGFFKGDSRQIQYSCNSSIIEILAATVND